MPKNRAAVVIGVDKTGGMTPLTCAARNAQETGDWLKKEGFDPVIAFTDAGNDTVGIDEIRKTIKKWVDGQTFEQLLIYFSGHGLWKNGNEFWLLSDAPRDADAAISCGESVALAKDCGIPSVIVISDACRTLPKTKQQELVRGSVIFPNDDVKRQRRAKIDKFLAAVEGTAAYEVPLDGKTESIFTYCLRQAYVRPDTKMVHTVDEDGTKIRVVPNSELEDFLRREVTETLSRVGKNLEQTPEVEVLSAPDVYIARVDETKPAAADKLSEPLGGIMGTLKNTLGSVKSIILTDRTRAMLRPPPRAPAHLSEVAALKIAEALDEVPSVPTNRWRDIHALADKSGFNRAVETAETTDPSVRHFETQTGFTVTGIGVIDARATGGAHAEILQNGDAGNPAIIRLIPENFHPGCTVVLRFGNGNGMPLAALHGYIGHVIVQDDRVVNVNYVPSDNSDRWDEYVKSKTQIERLRAAVAAAARFGVFRIRESTRAVNLAERIRVGKGLDPTLGLYAAYAYSAAGRDEEVLSVMEYMRQDLAADIFDVAMLAGQVARPVQSHAPALLPFCPLLTQGWNLLRAYRIELPKVLDDAQDDLVPALWTTFAPERTTLIFDAMIQGEIR